MGNAKKWRCNLCRKKFGSEAAVWSHVEIHTKNGKQAAPEPIPEVKEDYSEAEWYLHTHYGL